MKKNVLAIGITTLFLVMILMPAVTSIQVNPITIAKIADEEESDWPGFHYRIFGKISKYEILEYEEIEYLHARSVFIFGFVWNVSKKYPNLIFPTYIRRGLWLNLPLEGADIDIWPTPYSNYYYIKASGVI